MTGGAALYRRSTTAGGTPVLSGTSTVAFWTTSGSVASTIPIPRMRGRRADSPAAAPPGLHRGRTPRHRRRPRCRARLYSHRQAAPAVASPTPLWRTWSVDWQRPADPRRPGASGRLPGGTPVADWGRRPRSAPRAAARGSAGSPAGRRRWPPRTRHVPLTKRTTGQFELLLASFWLSTRACLLDLCDRVVAAGQDAEAWWLAAGPPAGDQRNPAIRCRGGYGWPRRWFPDRRFGRCRGG